LDCLPFAVETIEPSAGLLRARLRANAFLDWTLDGRRDDTRLDALLFEITVYGWLV
jgi:hypothetical protein